MKLLLAILGIVGSGLLGYILEPQLRPAITGKSSKSSKEKTSSQDSDKTDANGTTTADAEPVAPAKTFDYSSLQPSQLPEKVTLKVAATASTADQSESISVEAGKKVSSVRIESDILVFRLIGAVEGKIPVDQTNLVELLLANPPPPPTEVPEMPVKPEPEPTPEPESPEPTPAPEPAPEPVQPDPEPVATVALSSAEIIALMKTEISQGKIKQFTKEQVTEAKSAEDETIDGQKYQIGLVSYTADSIFGTRTFQAKALIKEGAISRWVSPTSGLEIE